MGRASSTKMLRLLMNGEDVGNWTVRPNGMHEFGYTASWLTLPHARPISLSMPLRTEPYRGEAVYAYFDNLLPNNDQIRRRIQNRFAAGGIDPFSLLQETGRDCVGAIQLLAPNDTGEDIRTIRATALDPAGIASLCNNTTRDAAFGKREQAGDEFRISLSGAKEKTALLFHEGRWMIPHGTTPSTHILKLPLGTIGQNHINMDLSIENEWLSLKILEAYGIPVAKATIETFSDVKSLVVERFDRKPSREGDWIMRLPQEDLCQATGTPPWQKYESDGGPGIEAIMQLLLGSARAEDDRKLFFQIQVAFFLLAAIDGHAKNFSIFLGPTGTFHLTPLYDTLSAFPVIGNGRNQLPPGEITMAMALWGKSRVYRWANMTRRHFITTARSCGLTGRAAETIIDDMLQRTPQVLMDTARQLPSGFPESVAGAIFDGVEQSQERIG
ncbi:type II toxin-antitoxin system HipA family toxin [Pelodictyon luteolum]|uniref:Putative regulatory protein n=1 Tax=Chlorobium luteolum (strain DSM 273 / BCRC 81028 / 2530) TaxID=319225 RepID=Q3B1M3_CHLL3|nr:type II toxin-antitoxin system HipA family toxin [Pelodictyon luteolum]ABB24758.1 putative regulatory protein [Pelodictyon luteolum DSM 273]